MSQVLISENEERQKRAERESGGEANDGSRVRPLEATPADGAVERTYQILLNFPHFSLCCVRVGAFLRNGLDMNLTMNALV